MIDSSIYTRQSEHSDDPRPIILCFVACYLPGYRGGGPIRSISNFVDQLGNEFDMRIVTLDRDALDTEPYRDIRVDAWNALGKAQVYYASIRTLRLQGIARLMRGTPHHILYLNSFFDFRFTTLPLMARCLRLAPMKPCVIAPRGEFAASALAIKASKKRLYMSAVRRTGLYSGLIWQASSQYEEKDIRQEFSSIAHEIKVAADLPPKVVTEASYGAQIYARESRPFRLIFLSRISPVKNLDYLLMALRHVKKDLHLTIYGPIREPDYWQKCQLLISSLPSSVTVKYCGELLPINVLGVFAEHDFFVFPTRGENFGHVILEALIASCPVLISDQTLWQPSPDGAVKVLPLANLSDWTAAIEHLASLSNHELEKCRLAARRYAEIYIANGSALENNRKLFIGAAGFSG